MEPVQTADDFQLIAGNPELLKMFQFFQSLDVLDALVNYFTIGAVGEILHEVHPANVVQTEINRCDRTRIIFV